MRVAKKFKEDVIGKETKEFLEETLGVVTSASSSLAKQKKQWTIVIPSRKRVIWRNSC